MINLGQAEKSGQRIVFKISMFHRQARAIKLASEVTASALQLTWKLNRMYFVLDKLMPTEYCSLYFSHTFFLGYKEFLLLAPPP